MRAQHPLGEHLSTCSSPENCAEYAAVLAMTPTQHANYLNDSTLRFAQQRTARQFRASQPRAATEDFSAPDSYAPSVAKRRAAEATPASRFAEEYKAARLRELDAEYAEMTARHAAAPRPRLTAAQVVEFTPPDPYRIALDKMKGDR